MTTSFQYEIDFFDSKLEGKARETINVVSVEAVPRAVQPKKSFMLYHLVGI